VDAATDLFARLNAEQAQAVRHERGPLRVLAGAGSGKTRVLTYRIAHLVTGRDVGPHEILAVTFTNKAAGEMAGRVRALVGTGGDRIWVSTFHSTCVRMLRRDGERIGLAPGFLIYDETDQGTLVRRLMEAAKLREKDLPPRQFLWFLDQAKNRLAPVEEVLAGRHPDVRDRVLTLAGAYQRALAQAGAVDFGDLLVQAVRLLREAKDVGEHYRRRFRHLLVDEFQDTNRAQYELLKLLVGPERNLFVVGDDDQSIYSWRGAEIANILEFGNDFPDARTVVLTRNYRSSARILAAASDVVARNLGRTPKRLTAENPAGERIVYYHADDEFDEARFVVTRIAVLRAEGTLARHADAAVFYRTNAQSRVIEDELRAAGTPYRVVGGTKFYDRREVKDALALVRLVVNPADTVAFQRIVALTEGVGEATARKVIALAEGGGGTVLDVVRRGVSGPGIPAKANAALRGLAVRIDAWAAARPAVPPSALLARVLEEGGLLPRLRADETVEGQGRAENLAELADAVRQFEAEHPGSDIALFLEQVSLISDPDLYDERADAVSLMTLHCAKGLEFPVVFIVGMEQNLFPHARSKASTAEMEEERRLCYVGMTRAKQRLFLVNAIRRHPFGGVPQWNAESPFLADVDPGLLEAAGAAVSARSGGLFDPPAPRRVARGARARRDEFDQSADVAGEPVYGDSTPDGQWSIGDRVRHARWGEGVVLSVATEDAEPTIAIRFVAGGVRTFKARYAMLERV
jgi:DNA helicase-2/ATP-dependent DNA helicase PcrA